MSHLNMDTFLRMCASTQLYAASIFTVTYIVAEWTVTTIQLHARHFYTAVATQLYVEHHYTCTASTEAPQHSCMHPGHLVPALHPLWFLVLHYILHLHLHIIHVYTITCTTCTTCLDDM